MQSNKTSIDGQFITSLVNHPTFITEINRLFRKQTPSSLSSSLYPSPNLPDMADEICNLLSQSYRQTVDQEALTVYQTCSQLTKDIDDLRLRLATCEANRT